MRKPHTTLFNSPLLVEGIEPKKPLGGGDFDESYFFLFLMLDQNTHTTCLDYMYVYSPGGGEKGNARQGTFYPDFLASFSQGKGKVIGRGVLRLVGEEKLDGLFSYFSIGYSHRVQTTI